MTKVNWPDGKDFAFTIFDDTDLSTLENTVKIYNFLKDLNIRSTKSVWALKGRENSIYAGSTLEDDDYLKWLIELKDEGFEIGYHGTTYHRSTRDEVILGFEKFFKNFGHDPITLAQHSDPRECETIYWGESRVSPGINRIIYNLLTKFKYTNIYKGHIPDSPYFWGDLCKNKIKYVRNFIYPNINTLKECPYMPYHDPERPYVNYWFDSSEGANVNTYINCISEERQDQLEEEGGACIMYTHFASGFYLDNRINPRFKELMLRLSKKNGWFVPVSQLLDYIAETQGYHIITRRERVKLERKWLRYKLTVGTT